MAKAHKQMRLLASLMVPEVRDFELFAVLDVLSDEARLHEHLPTRETDAVRRDVTGTVRQRGPIWADYLKQCEGIAKVAPLLPPNPNLQPFAEDGRPYYRAQLLQVDYDVYHSSWLNIEGDTIRLILFEHHSGTLEEYH